MTDNNDNSFPEIENSFSYYDLIADAPDFGFWQLTVKDAAALVVKDIWFAGEISVELPEADSYGWQDPELRQALSKHFSDFEKRLTEAIDGGSLKTTKIRRNLNEELDTEKTLVSQNDLRIWLKERGHEGGDAFEDYLDEEMHLHSSVVSEICNHRVILNSPELFPRNISQANLDPETAGIDELRQAVKELTNDKIELFTKNKQLEEILREAREYHSKKTEQPLSTRPRRTFLTLIAAICKKANIDYRGRGAAKRISELTEEIGAAVSDETIRPIISEIDDAVESRMK